MAVVGHGPAVGTGGRRGGNPAWLGANVRTLDLWDDPVNLIEDDDDENNVRPRAGLRALDRPVWPWLPCAVRGEATFDSVGALIAVTVGQVARIEPSSGFDDFVLHPYVPEELYARIRALEWRRSEFATEERHKVGPIVIDKAGHEVSVQGRPVQLTAKEFALLAYMCERRGKVLSRDHLLARVWGNRYDGGPRTVDIHVRRLRAKLGDALPLETLRGSGYKLRAPTGDDPDDLEEDLEE
ncbi:MAG: response regulator transcription factor [Polyangiaceae bacterium]